MPLFDSHKQNFLGVNLGSSSIKLVELTNDNGVPKLVTYGFTEQAFDVIRDDSKETVQKTIELLKKVCKTSRIQTTKCIAALPTFSVFSSIISLPQMSKKEVGSAIQWEAKKIIPMPLEEMILDWRLLTEETMEKAFSSQFNKVKEKFHFKDNSSIIQKEKKQDKTKDTKILVTAAPKNLVKKYMDIFSAAGLDLINLETEIFALIRSLLSNNQGVVMMVDIGAITTNISIVEKGIPFINRSIDIGGKSITKAIADGLEITFARAEQFKYDIGISGGGQTEVVPTTIETAIAPIIEEIKYSLSFYQSQSFSLSEKVDEEKKVEKIILTGGSSMLFNLVDYISRAIGIKTYLGNPWSMISYPEELKEVFQEIGPKLAVSVGLAMREIE